MSNSSAQYSATKTRPYRLTKRAEKQQETRLRIVEAAVQLHGTLGPARTSVALIAERAGVQRHTYYAHFPDERSLTMACSGLSLERDPLPDPDSWLATPPGRRRIEQGLRDLYAWYGRNAGLAACVLRDAEHHPATQEAIALRMTPVFERAAAVLGEGLSRAARALLAVALDFGGWRALASADAALNPAATMSKAIALLNGPGG
jgi:AcrR family transcriptional regulator